MQASCNEGLNRIRLADDIFHTILPNCHFTIALDTIYPLLSMSTVCNLDFHDNLLL